MNHPMYETVSYTQAENVVLISLNRLERRNVLNAALKRDLPIAFRYARDLEW